MASLPLMKTYKRQSEPVVSRLDYLFFLSCLIQEIRKRSSMSICIIQTVCVQPPRCFHGFLIGLSSLRKEALIMHSAVKCLQPEICAYPYSANIPAFHHLQEGLLKTPALYLF